MPPEIFQLLQGNCYYSGIRYPVQYPKNAAGGGIRFRLLGGVVYRPEAPEDKREWSLERTVVGQCPDEDNSHVKYGTGDGGRDDDPSNCPLESPEVEREANYE